MVRCPHKVFPEENKHRADVQYGGAVDIWAVGVLVVELVGGESPFKGACRGGACSSRAQWEGNVIYSTAGKGPAHGCLNQLI